MTQRARIILIVAIFFFIIIAGLLYYFAERTILPPAGDSIKREVEVKIKSGSSLTTIAKILHDEGVIREKGDFMFTAKLFGLTNQLKAGKYELPVGLSNYQILKKLSTGRVSAERIVIPEGYTAKQIASLLQQKMEIDSVQFMELIDDLDFIHKFELPDNSLEGYLYPNTYHFYWGMSASDVIKKLVHEFHRNFNDSLKQVALEKGWTIRQIVTLASIIEGEAMVDSERSIISAVYHNRMKKGMPLQADPTIQYIIPDGPRRLLKKDLAIDSPYNTYKYRGLPPGPVNNPGIASLKAALNPAAVPYLYFVAKGDGSHIFSRSLKEHLFAKSKFDQVRREVKKKNYARRQ